MIGAVSAGMELGQEVTVAKAIDGELAASDGGEKGVIVRREGTQAPQAGAFPCDGRADPLRCRSEASLDFHCCQGSRVAIVGGLRDLGNAGNGWCGVMR